MKKALSMIVISFLFVSLNLPALSQSGKGKRDSPATAITSENRLLSSLPAGRKRVLLAGVSNYGRDRKPSWWNLPSSDYSLKIITETFVNTLGFDIENIEILTDKTFVFDNNGQPWKVCAESDGKSEDCKIKSLSSTKGNIEKRFREFLVNQTNAGDIAVFYFIGHGQSIKNIMNKDFEADGNDESIVPLDYTAQDDPQNNIIDDEISVWTDELLARFPKQVTFIFDSCYSGTAHRGGEGLINIGGASLNPRKNASEKSTFDLTRRGNSLPPNFVFLSASQDNQLAYLHRKNGGIFTYHLVKELEKATPQTTYRELIENVRTSVAKESESSQTPQAEYSQDQKLFAGTVPPKENFFIARLDNKQNIVLEAGKFQGMTNGSKFEIYPNGTKKRDAEKVAATAVAVEVSERKSILKIETDKGFSALNNSPVVAFETEHNFDSVLKITIADKDKIKGLEGGADLLKLETSEFAETVDEKSAGWNIKIRFPFDCRNEKNAENDKICREEKSFRGVVLQRKDGSIIKRIKDDSNLSQNVKKALQDESYFFIFRSIFDSGSGNSGIAVRINMFDGGMAKFDAKKNEYICTEKNNAKGKEFQETGDLQLIPNQCIWIEFENIGENDVYITAVNWDAENRITGIYPLAKNESTDTISIFDNLLAGKSNKNKSKSPPLLFRVGNTFGLESFRLIATTGNFKDEFSNLINSLNTRDRGSLSPLGRLLLNMKTGRRGDNEIIKETEKWGTAIISFTVVPKISK